MAVKTAYEPKDARITFNEKYYSDDIDQIKKEPRKRITGTQALVEFLNTTSPEEFQKKRSSALFFGRKKSNKKPSHRKSYIEIIANPFNRTKKTGMTMIGAQLDRSLSKSTSIYSDQPVLPINRKSPMTITQANGKRQPPSLRVARLNDNPHDLNTIFTITNQENDLIEGGLKQRLKNYQLNSLQKPSDIITKSLALEHISALQVVSSMMMNEQQEEATNKKKCRHIQVQTMPFYPDDIAVAVHVEHEPITIIQNNDQDELKQRLAKVENELKQEKLVSSRLQAALEETRDQFEVLSGLAYKKLREVWEEKTRWENACIETKEKCWHDHQQQILGHINDDDDDLSFIDGTVMDFLEDQEEDLI